MKYKLETFEVESKSNLPNTLIFFLFFIFFFYSGGISYTLEKKILITSLNIENRFKHI